MIGYILCSLNGVQDPHVSLTGRCNIIEEPPLFSTDIKVLAPHDSPDILGTPETYKGLMELQCEDMSEAKNIGGWD